MGPLSEHPSRRCILRIPSSWYAVWMTIFVRIFSDENNACIRVTACLRSSLSSSIGRRDIAYAARLMNHSVVCRYSPPPYPAPTLRAPSFPPSSLLLLVPASSLPGVLHLLSGLFPLLERAPSRATGRGAQKRSDSDSKVGERFIGVAGSSGTIKESEKQWETREREEDAGEEGEKIFKQIKRDRGTGKLGVTNARPAKPKRATRCSTCA